MVMVMVMVMVRMIRVVCVVLEPVFRVASFPMIVWSFSMVVMVVALMRL